jgi:two-component system phosphate regulon sensor histidine kinase PhoR
MGPSHEVLLSVPLWLAVIGLLLLGSTLALAIWLLVRRRAGSASPSPSPDVSWLPTLLAALPCAAMLTDAQGRVRLSNDEARRRLWKSGRPAQLPPAVRDLVRRVANSGIPEGIEVAAAEDGGRHLWVEVTGLGQGDDFLVLARHEVEDRTSNPIYQRLMETLAHEFRTPLTAIMGHADILASCSIEEEALWRRSQAFISQETERLARLVEDLLVLSRLDRQTPLFAPVNLRAVAEQAISAVWQSAEEKGVTVALRAAEGLPRVRADADRLQRVLTNLLDNGVKYTPAGGQVTVALAPGSGCVEVEVSDTGIGIPQNELPHVFDPYFRGEEAERTASGTGLGLIIVHTVLAQHGAEIDVESAPGEGTTFSFELPTAG